MNTVRLHCKFFVTQSQYCAVHDHPPNSISSARWLARTLTQVNVNKLYIGVTGGTQASLSSSYYTDANHPSSKKVPLIQLSPLLHHLHNFLKRLWNNGDKLWKLGIRLASFLYTFSSFRGCLSLIIGRFMSKSCINRPSMLYDKADHHWHGRFDNVDCFCKLPISFFGRWRRSQSLSLHHEEHDYHPHLRTPPSTSQALVPYSITPMVRVEKNMSTRDNSTCLSTTAKAEGDCNHDIPGLSSEIPDFVGATSAEFERYERNVTSYVLTTDHQL